MIKLTVFRSRSASRLRARGPEVWKRLLVVALLALGFASNACLSDIDIPECARHPCGVSGASGSAADPNPVGGSDVAAGGTVSQGGHVHNGGEPGSSFSGDGGVAEAGGTAGGTAGVSSAGSGGDSPAGGGAGGTGGDSGQGGSAGKPSIPTLTPLSVPAPCGTNAYSTKLRVRGGIPPYHWQVSPAVEGWQVMVDPDALDSSFGLLTSASAGVAAVTVIVTDDLGQQGQVAYDVTPRAACWFAYTTWTATDGATLKVVDPVLEATPPITFAHNQGVYDFAFSPNGKYLSYRFGIDADHEKGRYLAVVNLVTWAEQQLSLSDQPSSASDAVTAYAWSGDSSTLAAAFVQAGSKYLGGVRFAADGQLSKLVPRATAVDSELYWLGTSVLAYYANGTIDYDSGTPELTPHDGFATGYYSELLPVGFGKGKFANDYAYELPVFVQTASDGFYLNSPSWPQLTFNWLDIGGVFPVDHIGRIISPSGRVTADPPSGPLKLYRAESAAPIDANAPDRDCPKLLTWAEGKERIACVRDVPADQQGKKHSELRIFDLASDDSLAVATLPGYCQKDVNSPSTTNPCGALEYDYSIATSNLQPRIFSRSGDWLAFSPKAANPQVAYLYLADLRTQPISVKQRFAINTIGDAASVVKLEFSPNERLLLGRFGDSLMVSSVSSSDVRLLPSFDAGAPDGNPICSEDFASTPDRWCGSPNRSAPFAWSPKSRLASYRSSDASSPKALTVVDLAQFPTFYSHVFPAPRCDTKCSGQFAFQPDP